VLGTGAIGGAKPAPADPPTPYDEPAADGGQPNPAGPPAGPAAGRSPDDPGPLLPGQVDPPRQPGQGQPPVRRKPMRFPEVLTTPTGWLLPAGALYSRNAIDTGGGITSDDRVGLGDVAEFGVATTDQVRERKLPDDKPDRIQPYVTASFRLGVEESRLFRAQPGVTLGFRKSFERTQGSEQDRRADPGGEQAPGSARRATRGRRCGTRRCSRPPRSGPTRSRRRDHAARSRSRAQLRAFGDRGPAAAARRSDRPRMGTRSFAMRARRRQDPAAARAVVGRALRVAYFMHLESGIAFRFIRQLQPARRPDLRPGRSPRTRSTAVDSLK
jgi:hypothetical protein